MRLRLLLLFICFSFSAKAENNPLLKQPIDFSKVTAAHVDDLVLQTKNLVKKISHNIDTVKPLNRTFSNTLLEVDNILNAIYNAELPLEVLDNTQSEEALHNAIDKAVHALNLLGDELFLDDKLYEALVEYGATENFKSLNPPQIRLYSELVNNFLRNGIQLNLAKRDEFWENSDRIFQMNNLYTKNLEEDKSFVTLTQSQLQGLEDYFYNPYKQADGSYKIPVTQNNFETILRFAANAEARKAMYIAQYSRAKKHNKEILKEIIRLRNRQSELLGYTNFAAYEVKANMAQTPQNVWGFLNTLSNDIRPKTQQDYNLLLDAKKKHIGASETTVYPYDIEYYSNIILNTTLEDYSDSIKQYLEATNLLASTMEYFQKFYGVVFQEDKSIPVWTSDVKAYSILDALTKEKLSFFYLDFFPRENKFADAGYYQITSSKQLENSRQLPSGALIFNFPRNKTGPQLISHKRFISFVGDFGRMMQSLLNKSDYAYFNALNVCKDFMEVPAFVSSNFAWNKIFLKSVSKNYQTGMPLSDELIDNMLQTKKLNSGLNASMQLFYSALDFTYFDGYNPNDKKSNVVKDVETKYTLFPYVEGVCIEGSLSHISSYSANYYLQEWSRVYADDIFSEFEKNNFSAQIGLKYRTEILEKGNAIDANKAVKGFLSREVNNKAFLKMLNE